MSIAEARLAVSVGASALGLVGNMPSGPGIIDDRLIAEIAAIVPPPVATFLLTSETRGDAIVDHVRRAGEPESHIDGDPNRPHPHNHRHADTRRLGFRRLRATAP